MTPLDRMRRARSALIINAPFFATLALGLELVEVGADFTETMATDGQRLYWNAAFVDECTDAELRGVIAHEVMHVALLHHTRRGGRDPELWNVAGDYVINGELVRSGFTLPAGGLVDSQYDGMTTEQVFAKLNAAPPQTAPQGGQSGAPGQPGADSGSGQPASDGGADAAQGNDPAGGQPGQPSGKPTGSTPGRFGDVLDAAPAHDKAALQAAELDAKAKTMQAAQVAKGAGLGGEVGKRLADEIRHPEVDWRAVLRRFVDESARRDYSWSRPNRRHVAAGLYLPGSVPDGLNRLAVVIDVSGSVDAEALGRFLGELQGSVDDVQPDAVDVIQCGDRITARDEYGPGDLIDPDLKGGGGTDMNPALAEVGDASAAIVFTDCRFPREVNDPGVPVLWARWGGKGKVPGFGELIDL